MFVIKNSQVNFLVFKDYKITCCMRKVVHVLNGIDTSDTRGICCFCKAFSLPSFFLCSSNFSCCFFYNLSYFTLFCAGIYSFSLQHCFIFCSILWNSTCEMFSSWIACDMASLMLSDFACDEDLIELCFSCLQQITGLIVGNQHYSQAVVCSCQIKPYIWIRPSHW